MKMPDYRRKHFAPLLAKTFRNSLAQRIAEQFPRIGGDRIVGACADLVLEVVWTHLRPVGNLVPGQVLWLAIDKDDPPRRYRKTEQTRMVPVVLTLSSPEDIEARIAGKKPAERRLDKALRMSREAHEQGGLLSNCDLAELLTTSDSSVSSVLPDTSEPPDRPFRAGPRFTMSGPPSPTKESYASSGTWKGSNPTRLHVKHTIHWRLSTAIWASLTEFAHAHNSA